MKKDRAKPSRQGSLSPRSGSPCGLASAGEGRQPTIVFTGERRHDHCQVLMQGKSMELQLSELQVLIDLVLGRSASETGYVQLSPVLVFRLRRRIDQAIGAGAGKALIETGTAEEYRLAIPEKRLAVQIALTPCFKELVEIGVVTPSDAAELKARCGRIARRQIDETVL